MSFSTLNIGTTALVTAQTALNTVGHNIANSSTDGYSRQRVSTTASLPNVKTYGSLGTGVEISTVHRVADEFLEQQVREAITSSENLAELQVGYEKLEVYFNELSDNDLSSAMDSYWSAASDVANNVEDISTRLAFLEQAQAMAGMFNTLSDNLSEFRSQLNDDILATVGDVNSIAEEIAELNVQIIRAEAGGTSGVMANDLRDQREVLIQELSGIMDVTVTEESNGSVTITQKSRFLVYQDKNYELATEGVSEDGFLTQVLVFAADGEEVTLGGGLLAAQVEMRDTIIPSYQDDIDQLAASFLWETNRIVSQGCGLEGYSEITGTTSVMNPEAKLDSLEYDFNAMPGTYEIVNGNFEMIVYDSVSGQETTVSVEIDLDGSSSDPDTILYDETNPTATNSLVYKMQSALDGVAAGAFTVELNASGHLSIESNVEEYQLGFGEDTSGVVAALGINTLFDGYDANTIAVNEDMLENPQYLQCAQGFTSGDNTNINAVLALRKTAVLESGTSTLDDFYESIVGRLGIEGAQVDSEYETEQDVLTYVQNQRESLSGVNMDEELTLMIQYQRAYQSAARFIAIADECYETLINM